MARGARSLGGDRRGRRGRDDTISPMSPSEERSRVGRPTAPRRSSPGGRCSEPRLFAVGRTTRWRTPRERSSSKGTMDRGGTSRYGSWPSRASRSAMWWAQTQPLPTQSSRPGRRATSRVLYCVLGHRALVAAEQGAWDAAAAHIAESDTIDPAPTGRRVPLECPVARGPHQAADPSRGYRRGASRARSRDGSATAPDCRGPGRSGPAPSRVRAGPCRDRRPGRRTRARCPGERRDPRSSRSRRPPCRGGRAPGDPGRPGARARRGRHEPHGRRAPRPVIPAVLPLVQGDRPAPRRQGDDDQVASACDLPEAGRGDPQRRRRPGRRRRAPRAVLAGRSVPAAVSRPSRA